MKRSIITHWVKIVAGSFCLSAQLICHAQSPPTNLWLLRMSGYVADSSPAIAADGTIYQADFAGKMRAVTPQGKVKWAFKINSEIKSSPAIADDGTIYFGARDRKFYAVTPRGKLKWAFPTGAWIDSSPAIAGDGTIYFGSWDANFYALNPNGSKKWVFATSNIVVSSPAIGKNGTIYFGSHDKKFYALRPDGSLLWSFTTGAPIISSPAISLDGTIYFTSTDGNLYALRPDGSELWRLHTGGATESSPVIDERGNLYLSVNKCDISVGPDGKAGLRWCSDVLIDASPAVAANNVIYFPAPWRQLFALQQNGGGLWQVDTTGNLVASPVIGSDGTVFICDGKFLYAINSTNGLGPPAKSSWPMFRADARHTGRVQSAN
ncbi:MAG: PQQ-binding-like beta-propeller repeat protein [Verrucomicrobiota bacterium]|jgi:outer membrane protein assembly factor BamB